ncbi:YqgE/AlgH family protein [Rhodobacteraceae bacterium D3-12]|nr:YqgE/AlgH family protein [Rhodobacteraceae bacterium D3-12]
MNDATLPDTIPTDAIDLTGKMLIAMPGMGDPRFEKSVVFICAHSPDGAMGIIINKPTGDLRLKDLVEQLDIGDGTCLRDHPVHFGGPVEPGRGFVLHSGEYVSNISTLRVSDEFGMTATLDVLEELAAGAGPAFAIMALGYSGWGPGQLEDEILSNGWLTCEAEQSLVFEEADLRKWEAALKTLGVDPLTLSAAAGHA